MVSLRRRSTLLAVSILGISLRCGVFAYGVWLRRWRRRNLGGLDTLVGFSARAIAACRAVETRRGADALVVDPLAEALAGEAGMKRIETMLARYKTLSGAKSQDTQAEKPTDAASEETNATLVRKQPAQRVVGRIVMRTLIFDDAVLAMTGATPRCLFDGLRVTVQATNHQPCKQVVLLGAGMDTRAWRLALPEGVRWFEVDTKDVLAAKRKEMEALGADFTGPSSSNVGPVHDAPFPLHASSYVGVSSDLQVTGWSAGLITQGFSSSIPTLWILEGLLYYLAQDTVPALFQEMAHVSAAGSVMVASAVSQKVTARMQGGGGITGQWKWGAPGTVDEWPEYWQASGWRTTSIKYWMHVADEYGLKAMKYGSRKDTTEGGATAQNRETIPTDNEDEDYHKQAGIVFAVRM